MHASYLAGWLYSYRQRAECSGLVEHTCDQLDSSKSMDIWKGKVIQVPNVDGWKSFAVQEVLPKKMGAPRGKKISKRHVKGRQLLHVPRFKCCFQNS